MKNCKDGNQLFFNFEIDRKRKSVDKRTPNIFILNDWVMKWMTVYICNFGINTSGYSALN
jgi:hypothetical protein